MWLQTKSDDDYALRFADWWEADVEAMVRKDVNHPSVILYSIGNEVPDGSTPVGLQLGRALAEKVRALDDTRFVTQAVTRPARRRPRVVRRHPRRRDRDRNRRGDRRQHRGHEPRRRSWARRCARRSSRPRRARRSRTSTCAGYNYMATRFELDGELFPHRVIVATESHPPSIDTRLGRGVADNPQRHRRLHLDRLGLPRRGGHRPASSTGSSRTRSACPRSSATTRGSPPGAPTSTSPVTAFRSRTTARSSSAAAPTRTSPCDGPSTTARPSCTRARGRGATSCRAGAGPATRARRSSSRSTPMPTRWSCCVNGRSLGRQPAGAAPVPRRVRHHVRARSAGGGRLARRYELGRTSCARRRSGAARRRVPTATEIRADPSDLAFVELTLVDEAGSLYTRADRQVTVELDGPGVLQGLGSANPCTEEGFTDVACTTFDGRALAVVRPTGPGRSPRGDGRRMRTGRVRIEAALIVGRR